MPLHQCIALFVVSLSYAGLTSLRVSPLRARLRQPAVWGALALAAAMASAASGFAAHLAHAGTGFVTRRGWPKPYLFQFVGEDGARAFTLEPLYFAGNALVYAAGMLALLTTFAALSRRIGS
jgi:hypothetical protein